MAAPISAADRAQTNRTSAADRAAISRKNGCMGRGPTSSEGKMRSRMNALKHGMTARIPVLPGEDPEIFRRHVQGILDSVDPRNALELALAEQAAMSLWKIERAERVEATRAAATIRAAEAKAETRQQEELFALGRWLMANTVKTKKEAAEDLLAFLPADRHAAFRAGRGEPLAILLRIEATADGCGWLLERWDQLRGRLERDGAWDVEEMITAAQLRGQRPLFQETAQWECLVQERYITGNPALIEEGRRQLLDQLTEGLSVDGAGTAAALRRLVEEETARLEELAAARREREAVDRSELADRLAMDTTGEGEKVWRCQNECDRKLHRAVAGLLKLRRAEGLGVAGDPAPDGSPEPEPGAAGAFEPQGGPADGREAEAEADADAPVRPETNGESREDDDPVASGPSAVAGVDSPSVPEAEGLAPADAVAAADPASAGPAAPRRPADEPEGHAVARNEPSPAAGGTTGRTDGAEVSSSSPIRSTSPDFARSTNAPVAAAITLFGLLVCAGFATAWATSPVASRAAYPIRPRGRAVGLGAPTTPRAAAWLGRLPAPPGKRGQRPAATESPPKPPIPERQAEWAIRRDFADLSQESARPQFWRPRTS